MTSCSLDHTGVCRGGGERSGGKEGGEGGEGGDWRDGEEKREGSRGVRTGVEGGGGGDVDQGWRIGGGGLLAKQRRNEKKYPWNPTAQFFKTEKWECWLG